jgi:hypothetical protein|tara:strand:- start:695 stop:940 length:246 start_codon:yes stop_codon:yes gene_type:complete
VNFGLEKQLDRIVETLALSALLQASPSKKIEKRLKKIAFPLEIELDNSIVLQEHERVVTCAELDDLYSKGYKDGKEGKNDL